jgi:hypothetical protein
MAVVQAFSAADKQPCLTNCLVEINGLKDQYARDGVVEVTIRNRAGRDLLIDVVAEGYTSGEWIEVTSSIQNPNKPFAKIVKAIPLQAAVTVDTSYDFARAFAAIRKQAPRMEIPSLLRLRVDVLVKGRKVQVVRSKPFRVG